MAKTKRQFSPEETETIINRYKTTNVLLKDIAKDYHCANKTIRELLIKNRVTIHKRGRIIPEKDIQEAIKMYNEGKSLAEKAEIYPEDFINHLREYSPNYKEAWISISLTVIFGLLVYIIPIYLTERDHIGPYPLWLHNFYCAADFMGIWVFLENYKSTKFNAI